MRRFLMMLMLVLSFSVFAEDKEIGYRAAGVSEQNLYPEGDYVNFPSVVNSLNRELLALEMNFYLNNWDNTEDRNVTGIRNDRDGDFFLNLGAFQMLPGDDLVLGYGGSASFNWDTTTDFTDDSYAVNGQKFTDYETDIFFTLNPEFVLGLGMGDLVFGIYGMFDNTFNTGWEEIAMVSDSTLNGGEAYYQVGTSQGNNTHEAFLSMSFSPQGVISPWTLGVFNDLAYEYRINYRSIDSDADTFNDKVVDEETYQSMAVLEGGAGQAYYDELDDFFSYSLGLQGVLNFENSPLTIHGYWVPVSLSYSTDYVRTNEGDQNRTTAVTNSSLWNAGVYAVYEIDMGTFHSLRLGTGITSSLTSYTEEDLDAAGDSTFDANNPDGYPEVALGADPVDGSINNLASIMSFQLPLLAEYRIYPAAGVTLFSSATGGILLETRTNKAFNTTDNTVWSESRTQFRPQIVGDFTTGIEFNMPEDKTVILATSFRAFDFDSNTNWDGLPYNDGGTSNNAASIENDTYRKDLNLDFSVVIRY